VRSDAIIDPSASSLRRESTLLAVGCAILLALKIGVLAVFGPTSLPDTSGYVAYADAILNGTFKHVDLAADPLPVTLVRVIGYPAIIAAAKFVAGRDWAWVVVLLQFAVSLCATAMVYRLAHAIRLGMWLSLGVAAAYATSMQFVVDQAILSDSLCGSTATIATCLMAIVALRRMSTSLIVFLGTGVLLAAAFLVRDVIAYVAVGLLPLVVAAAMVERTKLRRWAAGVLVFAPLIATHLAYTEWNRERIGAPVITTISQAALLAAMIEAARYDPSIFSGSTPIDDACRRVITMMQAGEVAYAVEPSIILHRDYGWDAVRMSHEATMAYLRAWRDHPVAMIRHVLSHFSETQLHQAVRPTETLRVVLLWNTGSDHEFARIREVRAGNWWMIPAVILHKVFETISVTVFLAFLVLSPVRLFRDGPTTEGIVSAGILLLYVTVGGLYATVHLEPRYLTPVVAGSIVVGTANIAWLVEIYRRRAEKPH